MPLETEDAPPVPAESIDRSKDFAWCSLDPVTFELVPYPAKQAQHLEAAFTRDNPSATILVPANEVGLVSTVYFSSDGHHVQRTTTGTGERKVCRVSWGNKAEFTGEEPCDVPESAFTRFGRVAWISVEPVQGILQPYSAENAHILEEALRVGEKSKRVTVTTLSGELSVLVTFSEDGRHNQSTMGGTRSVLRVAVASASDVHIPRYRRPEDDGIDSLRYRLHEREGHEDYHPKLDQAVWPSSFPNC
jgi:hypothetical protein